MLRLLLLPVLARAALFAVQDAGRPGIATEDKAPLSWWDGGPAYVLASSGAVRINFRAIHAYPPSSLVRPLDALDWHGVRCNASAWALCTSDVGQVLPASWPRMPQHPGDVTADGWNDLGCARSDNKRLVSLGVYDISACDILDEGLDLVYSQGMLYHRHSTLHTWMYWALVVVALVLVRSLSYNIRSLWEPESTEQARVNSRGGIIQSSIAALVAVASVLANSPTILAWSFWANVAAAGLLLTALIYNLRRLDEPAHHPQATPLVASVAALAMVLSDGDSLFITSADQVFYWSTFAYILVYIAVHAANLWILSCTGHSKDPPVYNVIVATLQLIASRLYAGAETPYNLVLITILAARVW